MSLYKEPVELLTNKESEQKILQLKMTLMLMTTKLIRSQDKSQKDIAELLGISQPRVSNLLNGDMHKFSIETLLGIASTISGTELLNKMESVVLQKLNNI